MKTEIESKRTNDLKKRRSQVSCVVIQRETAACVCGWKFEFESKMMKPVKNNIIMFIKRVIIDKNNRVLSVCIFILCKSNIF